MESILTSVKKMIGIEEEYEHFDPEIIMHINTVIASLRQMGVGLEKGFVVEDKADTWSDYVKINPNKLSMIKTYIGKKVKVMFDDTLSPSVVQAINNQLSELEWRMYIIMDNNGEG